MRRIYIVEDETSLRMILKKYLENEGYEVTDFEDGNSAIERIQDEPDLWILDIMLPDTDGYHIIKEIKKHNESTPVIFMSARNEELDRVVGLELGSDDYLPKPFLPRELVIRTNKLLKRIYKEEKHIKHEEIDLEGYKIDIAARGISDENGSIQLSNMEFELVLCFYENKNIALSREMILNKVWGENYFGSDRVVDDTIRRLRKKMKKISLETIYGYGYKLVVK